MFFQNSLFWSYEWNASFLGICDTAAVFSVCFFRTTVQGAAWGKWERRNHWPAALTKPSPLSRFTSPVGQQWRYNIQRLDQQKLMNQRCMVAIHSSRKAGVAVQKAGPWNNFTHANNGIFDFTWDKGHDILVARNTRSWLLIPIHYRNINWYHYTIRTCVLF